MIEELLIPHDLENNVNRMLKKKKLESEVKWYYQFDDKPQDEKHKNLQEITDRIDKREGFTILTANNISNIQDKNRRRFIVLKDINEIKKRIEIWEETTTD